MKLIPPGGYSEDDVDIRRRWLKEVAGQVVEEVPPDKAESYKGLVENQVGTLSLPLAVAGPLKIKGTYAEGLHYVPLCTVEGTLALSMTRGFYLTYLSGGIKTHHLGQHLNRSPIFSFGNIADAIGFGKWIDEHFDAIKQQAESTTRHGKLISIKQILVHSRMILNFDYHTGDAAGQNMVTIATHQACKYIEEHCPYQLSFLVESNFSGDKNASWRNMYDGRGHHVIGECVISHRFIKRILHVSVDHMISYLQDKHLASYIGGVLGLNVHAANALAAIYLATGQDVACVAENSNCITGYEKNEQGDLQVTLRMPSMTIGTVGGATRLNRQRANLRMLGCEGAGSAGKFAEIVCASVMALELSLLGAIVSDEFAQAHSNFGR